MHLRLQQYLPLISAVKIFAVSDNENLWLLRHVLGIPTVQTMVENRIRKFIGNFWMIRKNLLLYFSVMKFIMCFKCVLILVFFFVSPKIDHGSVAPFGDRDRRHCVGLWKNPDKKKPSKHLWCAISRIRGKETPWGIVTKFCMLVDIRDLIKFATFGDDRLGGLGVAGGRISHFPIDLSCRPYNTVALPCERVMSRNVHAITVVRDSARTKACNQWDIDAPQMRDINTTLWLLPHAEGETATWPPTETWTNARLHRETK